MLNINHITGNEAQNSFDKEGNMVGLEHWSPRIAAELAREEGIDELTEPHWHVIYAVRNLYLENGRSASARKVMKILEQEFVDEGGRRYLYELFPKGPVNQSSRLANVPVPFCASDPSFGWAG